MLADKANRLNESCRVTFLGHASALIEVNGKYILADPNLSRHIFFIIWRRGRVPMSARELPPADLVLISHGHYDHLDLPTLRKLPGEIPIVVPFGLRTLLRVAGRKEIVTLRKWQTYESGGLRVTSVPARHFSGRPPLFPATRYQGYIIESGDATVYFAGDTGIFNGMREIGEKWKIDIALLPIGAYNPPSFRKHHMSPEDAVEASRMLRAKVVVPIHWGAFKLSLEPMDEPIRKLREAADKGDRAQRIVILQPGESVSLYGQRGNRQIRVSTEFGESKTR